jgi:hypothetical protein
VAELCPAQVRVSQDAAREVGSGQIPLLQILTRKIGARQIGALAARLPLVKLLVRVQDVLQLFTFVSNGRPLALLFYRKGRDEQIEAELTARLPARSCGKLRMQSFGTTDAHRSTRMKKKQERNSELQNEKS